MEIAEPIMVLMEGTTGITETTEAISKHLNNLLRSK
jgi:hypothetical protein